MLFSSKHQLICGSDFSNNNINGRAYVVIFLTLFHVVSTQYYLENNDLYKS